ncbi:MAG: PEP-CTERM sorting domain-containing protein [Planctomycetota bacterium]
MPWVAMACMAAALTAPAWGQVQPSDAVASGTTTCSVFNRSDFEPVFTLEGGGFESDGFESSASVTSQACDLSGVLTGNDETETTREGIALAEVTVTLGDRPFVDARAAAIENFESPFPPNPQPIRDIAAAATGVATYEGVIRTVRPPPVALPLVPATLTAPYDLSVSGADSIASVEVTFAQVGNGTFSESRTTQSSFDPTDGTIHFAGELLANVVFEVQIIASASAEAIRNVTNSQFAQALIDPVIELDQAAADAFLGDATFQLTDFYEFAFSANLGSVDGDYNNSGAVEQGDLNLVLANWGADAAAVPLSARWANDPPTGRVDQDELNLVLNNWGATAPLISDISTVPEPGAGLGVGALLGAAATTRRSRP